MRFAVNRLGEEFFMNNHFHTSMLIIAGFVAGVCPAPAAHGDHLSAVHFDLPQVAAAEPAEPVLSDRRLVTVALRLSSMIESPEMPRIDQWLVRCQPRDRECADG